ncbi:MAG: TRAP transporter fused permease subunit [Pseudomonadota bacterium]|nr:TRAP transporter fused permease subunit [Pseudomonadota bacterium]
MATESKTGLSGLLISGVVFGLALAMAFTGIANSMPDVWILPRIGPLPSEPLRAGMLGASLLVVLLSNSFTGILAARSKRLLLPGVAIDAVLLGVGLFAFWRYYVDTSAIEDGLFFFEPMHIWTALAGSACMIIACWRIWGAPLAVCGIVAIFYFYTGEYWPWLLETAPVEFVESAEDLWFNQNDGVLGNILGIMIYTVFPFVLLGCMLERTGGGRSLIKIAFHLTRRYRGGPAHAAILASSLFGTMSGGAVTNVVGTGVITIPMIKRRGFDPSFAGGVEATASCGGQIMPPIMGSAALVMADFTGISYLTIIVAALVPALAYYASLFVSVIFESRRLGVTAAPDVEGELAVAPQDFVNLVMVIVPVVTVVTALLNGLSPAGSGLVALFILLPITFCNPEIRRNPLLIFVALSRGGQQFARLLMAIGVVGVIVAVLGATGLPNDFAQLAAKATDSWLFLTLLLAMASALLLGMGMPTLPAYLTIILIMGPSLQQFGLAVLTAHMFVFYYGVASSITPPVAIAAYAAASISGSPPLKTAVMAIRIGVVKFVIPFVFAYYPILLIVKESGVAFDTLGFASIIIRLLLAIYLLSSAVSAFDVRQLPVWEIVVRIALAVSVLYVDPVLHWSSTFVALTFLAWHYVRFRRAPDGRTA